MSTGMPSSIWMTRLRLAPKVQRQLDDLRPDPDLPDVNDKIARMARSLCEFEQRAFAAGYELGPTVYEFESGPNSYWASATRELRPRGGDVAPRTLGPSRDGQSPYPPPQRSEVPKRREPPAPASAGNSGGPLPDLTAVGWLHRQV